MSERIGLRDYNRRLRLLAERERAEAMREQRAASEAEPPPPALRSSCAHCVVRPPVAIVRDELGRDLHLCELHRHVIRYAGRLAYAPALGELPEARGRSIA